MSDQEPGDPPDAVNDGREPEGDATPTPEVDERDWQVFDWGAGSDGNRVQCVAVLATLVAEGALAATIGVVNLRYGAGVAHLLETGMWFGVAALCGFAAFEVVDKGAHGTRGHTGQFAAVLLAQVMALVLAAYVIISWLLASNHTSRVPVAVATPVAAVAAFWVVYLLARRPTDWKETVSTSTKVITAAVAFLGLFGFSLSSYIPHAERPRVDLATSLAEEQGTAASKPGSEVALKATITIHNRGDAAAVVIGSLYRIQSKPAGRQGVDFAGDPTTGGYSFNRRSEADYEVQMEDSNAGGGRWIDFGATNSSAELSTPDRVPRPTLLEADEIAPMEQRILPGQTWSTEVTVSVPAAEATTVRLTAEVQVIGEQYLGEARVCDSDNSQYPQDLGSPDERDVTFNPHVVRRLPLGQDGGPVKTSFEDSFVTGVGQSTETGILPTTAPSASIEVGADGQSRSRYSGTYEQRALFEVRYLCMERELIPQSAVQALVDKRATIRTYYILSSPPVAFGEDFYSAPDFFSVFQPTDQPFWPDASPEAFDENVATHAQYRFDTKAGSKEAQTTGVAKKLDKKNPTSYVESRSEYEVKG